MANTLSSSKTQKSQVEWGYVAQLESLYLERAREDCWVSFRPGVHWNWSSFIAALQCMSFLFQFSFFFNKKKLIIL